MAHLLLSDHTRAYYELYGDRNSNTVVFLHGYACTGQDWEPTAQALADSYRSLVLDFRNHGRSENSTRMITLDDLLADLDQALDSLKLGPVFLIGHSMGGMAGLKFTLMRPERVAGLVAADAFPYLQSVVDVFGSAEDPVNDPYGYGSVFDHHTDRLVVARIRDEMSQGVKRVPGSLFQSLLDFDVRQQLRKIERPVRLLLGARRTFRHEDMPTVLSRLGYDSLPGLDWRLIDSHHFVMLEQPTATADAIREFLTVQRSAG